MQSAGSNHSNEREPLAGLIERVTFHNADNGFACSASKLAAIANRSPCWVRRHRSPPGNTSSERHLGEQSRTWGGVSPPLFARDRADLGRRHGEILGLGPH